ncbi:dehydrogenase/reductase SDR family member 9-like [Lingula anatina]|uniref:Dehydrogenase/reductase SDR family member 9-like n=1 Tax=Lingula anatina TaxID=7574 RepID=A0A1S3IU98_LINAN|nr:dehydrogenase/reductase SDR family member 9-like [Lingula anatina]|eukprot:XP_013401782.1 dehydrogenase/reductase SDR family member 9-like [Lingula anatina]
MAWCCLTVVSCVLIGLLLLNWIARKLTIGAKVCREKYIAITGCDSGFGCLAAKRLHRMGFNVFAACLTESGAEALRNEEAHGPFIKPFIMDIASSESIKNGFEFVKAHVPGDIGLWGLINNAGIEGKYGPLEWLTRDDYRHCMEINFLGMAEVTTVFLPLLKKGQGRLVNTSSQLARLPIGDFPCYVASKCAVEGFSDAARQQLKCSNISVHLVEPGWFKTNITSEENYSHFIQAAFDGAPPEAQQEYNKDFMQDVKTRLFEARDAHACINVDWVVNDYIHAMTSWYPYARYGPNGAFATAVSYLPAPLSDYIVINTMNPAIIHAKMDMIRKRNLPKESENEKKEE